MNYVQKHLENVTVDDLLQFRERAFMSMASTCGRGGNYNLGVNAKGQFVVTTRTETFTFNEPAEAVEKYSELLINSNQ